MTHIAWAQAAARMESTKRAGNQESVPANDPRSVPVTLRALPGRLSCCNCGFGPRRSGGSVFHDWAPGLVPGAERDFH